jgi:hypothetical protein
MRERKLRVIKLNGSWRIQFQENDIWLTFAHAIFRTRKEARDNLYFYKYF